MRKIKRLGLSCISIPMFLFLAFLGTVGGWFTAQTKVTDCGEGKSLFTIQALFLRPTQPVAGEKVSLHLDYSVPAGVTVSAGEARYAVTYNFLPLSPIIEPLCKNIPCPLSTGSYSNITYMQWPSGLSGNLLTKITWVDVNARQLLCIYITAIL